MKAIICEKPGNFETIEVPEPTPSEGEVILRIRKIGICGTDYHAYKGNQPFFSYPRILGHEISAEIAEDMAGFKAGEPVVPVPYLNVVNAKHVRKERQIVALTYKRWVCTLMEECGNSCPFQQ